MITCFPNPEPDTIINKNTNVRSQDIDISDVCRLTDHMNSCKLAYSYLKGPGAKKYAFTCSAHKHNLSSSWAYVENLYKVEWVTE